MTDKLERYNEMRDFALTDEPKGTTKRGSGRSFVVQKHAARALHYDFRLEHDGVLLSWAVPKGPSLSPEDKRLAVRTEDHPVGYRDFEGTIPKGQYGGGSVIVWDKGTFRAVDALDAGLAKGHVAVELDGEKLHGRYDLVRLRDREDRGRGRENWLLVKKADEHAREGKKADIVKNAPKSVLSDRTVEEVAEGVVAPKASVRADAKKTKTTAKTKAEAKNKKSGAAPKRRTRAKRASKGVNLPEPGSVSPALATLVEELPRAEGYAYEIKYDGYRALAWIDDGEVSIRTRAGKDWTGSFPEIAAALARVRVRRAIVDGEIVHLDAHGKSSFQRLQHALGKGGRTTDLAYFVFDLLHCDGVDFTKEPLDVRKAKLRTLLAGVEAPLVMGDHATEHGEALFREACKRGLEGIVAKRLSSTYTSRRTKDWLKVKCQKRQELVIVGLTAPKGSRTGIGALLLGVYEGKKLVYAGKVGTGFSHASLVALGERLRPLVVKEPPVASPPRIAGATWVEPKLVCEVRFLEWTDEGRLRHPSFEGLREDKSARKVVREEEAPLPKAAKKPAATEDTTATEGKGGVAVPDADGKLVVGKTKVTHPERVMDRASGTTKGEIVAYCGAVAPYILPHAAKRPLMLLRCGDTWPGDGDFGPRTGKKKAAACFVQKHGGRGLVRGIHLGKVDDEDVLYATSEEELVHLFQLNTVELHGWGSRLPKPDKPDWVVFDLDPDVGLPFAEVASAALELRKELRKMGLETFVKTTGGKGLHVVLPLTPKAGRA